MIPCSKEKEIQEIRDMAVEQRADYRHIVKSIETIEKNHLTHMQASLASMEKEINKINVTMAKWVGGAAVVMAIIQFVINKLF